MAQIDWHIYRRLLNYVRPYRGRLILSVIASVGVAGSDAVAAKLVQPFIDWIVVEVRADLIKWVPLMVIGLALFKGGARYFQEYFIRTVGQLVMRDIRDEVFGHTLSLSMRYFSRSSTGSIMSRVTNDVTIMQSAVAEVLVGLLKEGMTLVALTGVAFYTDWKLAAIAFVILPLAGGPASAIGKRIKGYSRRGQAAMGDVTMVLEQALSGIKVIKSFGTEEDEDRKFRRQNNAYYSFISKVIQYDAASSPAMEFFGALGGAGVAWYGLHRVFVGTLTQGEFFSVIAAVIFMYTPAKKLSKLYNRVQQALGAAERVFELRSEPLEIQDRQDAIEMPRVRGEVVFDRVGFAYDDEAVLEDISFTAAPGEVVALVGSSGAGKTTVVGLLNRFYDVSFGSIRIDGQDIREVSLDSLRANLALVDQETFLFNDSVAGNIAYGRDEVCEKDVAEAARQAYADDFIRQLPEGYATVIGDRGVRLSGGQRQRVCIARAILRDAPILILDEATSALDTESEAMVQQALHNLMQNRTTLVIAHRLSTIMHADKILVLDKGHIVEHGRHQELLQNGGIYKRLYDMQFKD
ncbi:MAG: lipid A export permease/ATP-binding protein MsbA [Desulfuromonas sp.]|nr:MAG: lipid A export permease/ATP-binding protein MsbA [Desulfuromonas sp.]